MSETVTRGDVDNKVAMLSMAHHGYESMVQRHPIISRFGAGALWLYNQARANAGLNPDWNMNKKTMRQNAARIRKGEN